VREGLTRNSTTGVVLAAATLSCTLSVLVVILASMVSTYFGGLLLSLLLFQM